LKESFENISIQTNGTSLFLDINSDSGAKALTIVVTAQLLSSIGEKNNLKDTLVKAYLAKYE